MLAPQPGVGVFVTVFSVGHIGTAAPVLLTWLVLDRCWPAGDPAARAPGRLWFLPVAVGALLAWALTADPAATPSRQFPSGSTRCAPGTRIP
jgi:hypothetical protein